MRGGLTVLMGTENEEEIVQLVRNFEAHMQLCDECEYAYRQNNPRKYCTTGKTMLNDIWKFEEVIPG